MSSPNIYIKPKNETYVQALSDNEGVNYELREYFTFMVPGYWYSPKYKAKQWDGKKRLYNSYTGNIYFGLIPYIQKFALSRGYNVHIDKALRLTEDFTDKEADDLIKELKLPFQPYDYQLEAFKHGVRNQRALLLSPTSSGKSLMAYLFCMYHYEKNGLIVVPTTGLVKQLESDFIKYGIDEKIHTIYSGQAKTTTHRLTISTWQSIYKQPASYFSRYGFIIGDEAHKFDANSISQIMEKSVETRYRIGMTGSLKESKTHALVLEGLFGQQKVVTKTKKLMKKGVVSDLKINAVIFEYKEEEKKLVKQLKYQDELDFICNHELRNRKICNLAERLKGNTLILFNYVEKHGKVLYERLKNANINKEIFFVHGGIDVDEREKVRQKVEQIDNAVIVASYGSFATGTNIVNLHNLVLAQSFKSKVLNLQSIGRILRKGENATKATLYDLVDDFSHLKYQNYTLKHFLERVELYNNEGFDYKILRYKLQ